VVRSREVEPSSEDRHLALGAGNKLPIERKSDFAAYPNHLPTLRTQQRVRALQH
jgi:hypothetical protein